MRKRTQAFAFLVFFLGLWQGICADDATQTNSMPVIVIETLGGNKAEVPGWQPAVGQGISEMLIESLEGPDNRFQVLETAETASSQNQPTPDESNPGGGGTKSATSGPAGSKRTVQASGTNPGNTNTDDTIGSGKSDAGASDSDFTFCGDVTQFTTQTNSSKVGDFLSSSPFASLGTKVVTAHVQIAWRLVDTETKKVIKRGITACSASGSEFDMADLAAAGANTTLVASAASHVKTTTGEKNQANNLASVNNFFSGLNKAFGNPNGGNGNENIAGNSGTTAKSPVKAAPKTAAAGEAAASDSAPIGYGDPAFMNSALGRATCKAVTNIIEQLAAITLPEPGRVTKSKAATDALRHAPGKVLAVADKDTIIVSLGSKEGFKEGDHLELYQTTDVKDDKGTVVFTDEKLVGEIILSEVQAEHSRGSYAGDAQVQQGWTVKGK